jgi:hypothetical protein
MTRFGRVAALVCATLAPAFSGTGVAQAATNLNGNRLNSPVRLHEDSNYRGTPTDLPPNSRGSLTNTPMDNAASSHRALDAICVPS